MDGFGRADVLARICEQVAKGRLAHAAGILTRDYPFVTRLPVGRSHDEGTSTRVFVRDGFIDRYSGERLVFPGVLRLLSHLMPEAFPFHPNWKMSATHPAYWELFPTIDHVIPVTRGGADDEPNWVTTSMLRNSAKGLWTVDELGWQLRPPGSERAWDGLMNWFVYYVETDTRLVANRYLSRWHRAAIASGARGV